MWRYSLVLLAGLAVAAPAPASWTSGLFDETTKDFGAVPRGPTLSHLFFLTNNTGKKIHISGVRVSCGCVSASALERDVAPGKSTAIQAYMDTRRFVGHKRVTIYVTLDQPQWEELSLAVQANSREDLSVTPDGFNLGAAKYGTSPKATVTVTIYGGSYQITDVERESTYVETALKPVKQGGGESAYEVTATLRADTPAGKWFTDVWLKTNHPGMPRIRVPLSVEVAAAVKAEQPNKATPDKPVKVAGDPVKKPN